MSNQVDPRPGNYYVSVISANGARFLKALGPFNNHADALAKVDKVRLYVSQEYPDESVFCEFGTCRLPDDDSVPIRAGKFNAVFGLPS